MDQMISAQVHEIKPEDFKTSIQVSACYVEVDGHLHADAYRKGSLVIRNFLQRVKHGLNQALEQIGPVLIVAHGGVHLAICHGMNIPEYSWVIDNCQLVHFSTDKSTDEWKATILQTNTTQSLKV